MKRAGKWRTGILGVCLLAPSAVHAHAQTAQPVIVDTDAGDDIDDAFALALLVRSPEVKLLGVSTAFGDTALRAHLVMHLLADAGRPEIPVTAGVVTAPRSKFSQAAYAQADTHALSAESGPAMILRLARKQPGQITLLAIGPLSNIGAAIDEDPDGFRKLKRVVIMAGSIDHGYTSDGKPGNPPSSEWNVRIDPAGLRKLLTSGVPVAMMPLDSTQIVLPSVMEQRIAVSQNPMDAALMELRHEFGRPHVVLYDALTAAYVFRPELCPTVPIRIAVDDAGFTKREQGAPNVEVCLHASEDKFLSLLGTRLIPR